MLEDSISILKGNVRLASNLWTWNVDIYILYIYIYIYHRRGQGINHETPWDNNILRVCSCLEHTFPEDPAYCCSSSAINFSVTHFKSVVYVGVDWKHLRFGGIVLLASGHK